MNTATSEGKDAVQPELSVLIVNWNTKQLLEDCLHSLFASPIISAIEVIVVDNASSDDSVKMCQEIFPKTRIIKNSTNVGFGPASNQGVIASRADLLLLLNSDTIVLPHSLEKMMMTIKNDSSIGLVGCRLLNQDGSNQQSCMRFPNLSLILIQELMLYKLSSKLPRHFVEPPFIDTVMECDWVYGAAMMIRKKTIESVGFFDPNIWMYAEEMDLCYRIKKSGWKIMFDPKAKITHLGEGSWKGESYSPTFLKMAGLLYFIKKHFSFLTYITVRLLVSCGAMLRFSLWLLWTFLHYFDADKRKRGLLEIKSNMHFLLQNMGIH